MFNEVPMTPTTYKSQLAKLLATENISFQHDPSAKTAYFDIKRRLLVLPVWRNISNDLYDMLVVHEVGHALDTPADSWLNGIKNIVKAVFGEENPRAEPAVKGFMNVIEDARIDKRQKRRYPGSRRNYVVGYKELIERDFFGTAKLDIQKLPFIDRANIYFKGGFALGIKFDSEERGFIQRMEEAETFDEVLTLTEEIYRWSKERGEMDRQTPDEHKFDEDEDGDGEYSYSDDESEYEYEDDGEMRDGDTDGEGDDESEDSDTDGDGDSEDDGDDEGTGKRGERGEGDIDENSNTGAPNKSEGAGSSGLSAEDDYVPESVTERAWQQNQDNLVVNENFNYVYLDIPNPKTRSIVDDYKVVLPQMYDSLTNHRGVDWSFAVGKKLAKFKSEENNAISFMVKEFEMRKQADAYSKVNIAKTGVIDTNKLHSYKYNDDIFRRLSIVPNGKNHGFVFIIDWSGSMMASLTNTLKQLFSMVLFCKRVQIPFEAYLFRDLNQREQASGMFKHDGKDQFESDGAMINFAPFKLRNVLSSRMNIADLNKAMTCLFAKRIPSDPMNGTPLNQAIVAAESVVNDFRKRNKLEVVNTVILTDGDSNNIAGYDRFGSVHDYRTRKFFVRDNVTKKEYPIKGNITEAYNQLTEVFLKCLKDRTGSNVIGMYLSSDSIGYTCSRYFSDVRDRNPIQKFWKENKFVPVTTAGYDEYFIINAREMNITNDALQVNSTMTKAKVAKEFLRFAEKKTTNRVLLGRIIDRVTSNAKVKAMKIT
jgi:hypothetical protein